MPNSAHTEAYSIDSTAIAAALWRRKWRILVITFVLLALTFVALMFVPKSYQSSASILVERRDTGILSGAGSATGVAPGLDTAAVASQMEVIRSRDTLLDAITSAGLEKEPALSRVNKSALSGVLGLFGLGSKTQPKASDNSVLANVRKGLTVIQERDSRVITIIFNAGDAELAAKVANAVAETYVKRRAGQVVEDTADATAWLKIEIEKLRKRVTDADSKVAAYKVDKDLFVGQNNTSLTDQQLSTVSSQISAAQERQSAAQSRAEVIGRMVRSGQGVESLPEVGNSVIVQKLLEQRSTVEAERAQQLSTLLPGHPTVKALDAQIAAINAQIRSEARRLANSLETQAKVEGDVVQSLKDELTRLKLSASGAARNGVTLSELEREAKAQRDLLESYLIKYRDSAARTDANSALPDVRIVSYAAASPVPASPKISLIMLAVFLVSFVGQIGYVLFAELVSGRALVADDEEEEDVKVSNVTRLKPAPKEPPLVAEPMPTTAFSEHGLAQEAPEMPAVPEGLVKHSIPTAAEKTVDDLHARDDGDLAGTDFAPQDDFADRSDTEHRNEEPRRGEGIEAVETPMRDIVSEVSPAAAMPEQSENAELADLGDELAPIIARMIAGHEHAVFLADMAGQEGSDVIIDVILSALRAEGLSLAIVDAAGGQSAGMLGLTDLCAGRASFGDVVQRTHDGDVALVPWGQEQRLDMRSGAAATLVEALLDIFDVAIIATGRPGMASSLAAFSGIKGPLLVGGAADAGSSVRAAIKVDAAALGFSRIHMLENETAQARVA